VLISDIEMPREDGYAFIRRVRALDNRAIARTPAVALTAYGRVEDRLRTLAAGYSMHVPKPVDPTELAIIVANLAGRTRAAERLDRGPARGSTGRTTRHDGSSGRCFRR